MERKVTMAEIGRMLGVSTVTVSKALSGKDGVGKELRQKIHQTAKELGYVPRPSNSGEEPWTVGILIHEKFLDKEQSFYLSMYERTVAMLAAHNIFGILEKVLWGDSANERMPRLLVSGRVQALIVIGNMEPEYLQMLQQTGLPIVLLDSYHAQEDLDAVISDGYYGSYRMTDYLIQKGHREIAFFGSVGATSSITDRYYGYRRALQEHDLIFRKDWVLPDRNETGNHTLTLPEEMPTAFVCNCDSSAYLLIQQLREKGIRVPEDISVVGFDDFLFSNLSKPRITTYAVDMDAMAKSCVKVLLDRMKNPQKPKRFMVIAGHLVEKESVRRIDV